VAHRVYRALQDTKLRAPSTNCLAPMGAEAILSGLLRGIKAEFYTASTRPPSVYRGNPFQIEVGLAYGGELGSDRRDDSVETGKRDREAVTARLIRFANRVPLLYQQSSCALFKGVTDIKWNNYGLSQPGGGLPQAPLVVFIHMASVWVPFVSEGKEAVADYDEIRKEIKLAVAECARRLSTLLRRKRTKAAYTKRRDVFTRYIGEVVDAVHSMSPINRDDFRESLILLSNQYTAQADMAFDDHGKVIQRRQMGNDLGLADTIVVDREEPPPDSTMLFDVGDKQCATATKKAARRKKPSKKSRRKR
ncbi:MAG: hypothetical protein IIC01_09165, partial [Planctomycetes bacterium]|nr:hypothetical protein [Planctomycetota bacterium]